MRTRRHRVPASNEFDRMLTRVLVARDLNNDDLRVPLEKDEQLRPHRRIVYSVAARWRLGFGMSRAKAFASSIHAVTASRTDASAASAVSPSDMQPQRNEAAARIVGQRFDDDRVLKTWHRAVPSPHL
jgi:hypothetical protein